VSGEPPPALRCRGITKRFGRLIANDCIDFDVRAGEIHALIGENGAGKSTLMNVLYGTFAPDAGTIEVSGRPVRFASCADAMRAGIGMVFQHYLLVERFSVAENVLLGREPVSRGLLDRGSAREAVRESAARYRFPIDPSACVETLGVGARQQVELLKALDRDPHVVILDEPTSALSPLETEGLFEVVRQLRREGRAVIFITHKLKEVMQLSDRITVLRRGRIVGTLDRSQANESLLGSMMVSGSPAREAFNANRVEADAGPRGSRAVLSVRDLTVSGDAGAQSVGGISLECGAGEVVGIAGVEGNGQQEFAEALYGMRSASAGTVTLEGMEITHASLPLRRRAGLRYVSPDRQREGLVLDFDAVENTLLGNERLQPRSTFVDRSIWAARADEIATSFRIAGYSRAAPMRAYSGGTQQKFLVGREASAGARAIIAFAPTRGVDIGAAAAIYDRLRQLQASGACVLLISYDLDEIRALAHRVLVFYKGKVAGELPVDRADDVTLGRLMGGFAA
jgi:simple sugar transport system ATP-binding protein